MPTGPKGQKRPADVGAVHRLVQLHSHPQDAENVACDGSWRVDDLVIQVPGRWTVRIDILVSDFEMVKIEAPVDIRP